MRDEEHEWWWSDQHFNWKAIIFWVEQVFVLKVGWSWSALTWEKTWSTKTNRIESTNGLIIFSSL